MSAIYGILRMHGNPAGDDDLKKIRIGLANRVTDGEGEWRDTQTALGFSKLSLYPPHAGDRLLFESGDFVVVADSRLDDRESLMKQLGLDASGGMQPPDSELILQAYRRWGTQCPEHLDGEFAFAILDKRTHTLFAATDPIGFRPFFYSIESDRFLFCSEIKGIVAAMGRQPAFDEEHLFDNHFLRGDQTHTYVKGVNALCGGKTLEFRDRTCSLRSYWQLAATGKYRFTSDEEWVGQLRELLIRAVEKRISPVGNTGVSLSGGLDSGTVAGILAKVLAAKNKPLYTFSSVLPPGHEGVERDERYYVDQMSRMYPNVIPTFVDAGDSGPFDPIQSAFAADEGIPNGYFYMEQALLQAAQNKGVTTFFTGFGGDGSVTTPKSGVYQLISEGAFARAFRVMKALSAYDGASMSSVVKHEYLSLTSAWGAVRSLVRRPAHPSVVTHVSPAFLEHYLPRLTASPDRYAMSGHFQAVNNGKIGRIAGALSNRNARYGMASCDPLFDKHLMEFMADVPAHLYTIGGQRRGLIRAAIDGLVPPEIRWRRDKLPYAPDAFRRALGKANEVANELWSARYDFVFDRFFSRASLLRQLPKLEPLAGFRSATSLQSIRTIQAVLTVRVLAHLRDEGFII